jgi:hypothetical protein
MKPANRFYGYSPPADPPENLVMIRCQACQKSSYSAQWIANRGQCPLCHAPFTGNLSED